jgi:hypothetical protein
MIQRYLHDLLTVGVQTYQADENLLDDLFDELYELENTEIQAIKTYFQSKGLNVINGYPRRTTEWPAVAIILAGESEAEPYVGNYAGIIDDGELQGAEIEGSIWRHHYQLPVATEHPDVTAYLYEMVKSIIFAGLGTLVNQGCFQFTFEGADLAPDSRYMPEQLFVRQLTFGCSREFALIDRQSRLNKAFRIAGLHVDSSGSPGDVGGVKTLVTPYAEGETDG